MTDEQRKLCAELRNFCTTYEDQVAIGANLNEAIKRVLREFNFGINDEAEAAQVGVLARAILVQLDQAGYQITRKVRRPIQQSRDASMSITYEDQVPYAKAAADEIERLATEVERLTTIMSGNVRLVEELDDGAIFEVGSPLPRGADSE